MLKPTSSRKLEILNSTSGYLIKRVLDSATLHNGRPSSSEIVKRINKEGPNLLFIPSSEYTDPRELVQEIGELFLDGLSINGKNEVASTYIRQAKRAKREKRYFSRNEEDLIRRYGQNFYWPALQDLSQFLEGHGYKSIAKRGLESELLNWYEIERNLIHISDEFGDPERRG